MKLDEAIEILQYHSERNADVAGTAWANALKLGIEALKFIQGLHATGAMPSAARLPGETKE